MTKSAAGVRISISYLEIIVVFRSVIMGKLFSGVNAVNTGAFRVSLLKHLPQ